MPKELPKTYEASLYEDAIYKHWEESGLFTAKIDESKAPYVIHLPPPNATGTLHLGHAVMLSIEDILARYHRMRGEPTLWLPGTDHASIATQNKVEKIIASEGTDRHQMGREEFLKRVEEFVAQSQTTIRGQMRKMGASCDWSRERYTLDTGLSHAVQTQFLQMYEDGLIYRGYRIVNWCPRCASTLADDEVENKNTNAKLYFIKYGKFVIATSRPETKLADTAMAVHPDDPRYKDEIGKEYDIDLAGHKIHVKVIADENVSQEQGTGALGVTPGHSMVDYEMAQKNNLPIIKLIQEDGTLSEAGGKYAGMAVSEAREKFVADLESAGQIVKIEEYMQPLSVCYRCGSTVEPLPSKQWFIDVHKKIKDPKLLVELPNSNLDLKNKSLKEISLEVVRNHQIEIIPERFEKTYFHWMENLRDWCISRQIWFGHRIPAWYCTHCHDPKAEKETGILVSIEMPEKCPLCGGSDFVQDPDTLDTWFSSGMWTYSTLGWPEKTKDLQYFHPTSCLETGYDILFFWVARMILMTTYAMHQVPFTHVYLHGLIRTRDGAKMSKSHPETCIDPLEVIEKYGADSVRLSLVMGTSPGNDTKLYEEKIVGFRNTVNKLWNTARFAMMKLEDFSDQEIETKKLTLADQWILSRMQEVIKSTTEKLEEYQLSEAGQILYDFLWRDFADWYLEASKQNFNQAVLIYILKNLLKLFQPFAPFVTEKIWQELGEKDLLHAPWPTVEKKFIFSKADKDFTELQEVVTIIRNLRSESNIPASQKIHAILQSNNTKLYTENSELIKILTRTENLEITEKFSEVAMSASGTTGEARIYIPLAETLDLGAERVRLEKEIMNLKNYVQAVTQKLSNEKFTAHAPEEIISAERAKLEEAQDKLTALEKNLTQIK